MTENFRHLSWEYNIDIKVYFFVVYQAKITTVLNSLDKYSNYTLYIHQCVLVFM